MLNTVMDVLRTIFLLMAIRLDGKRQCETFLTVVLSLPLSSPSITTKTLYYVKSVEGGFGDGCKAQSDAQTLLEMWQV